MRNYIILNGVNSNTITGLLISTLPPITKPKIRTQTEEIDGRDGDIVTKLGYSAYDKEIQIGLYGNFNINEVIAYFNTEGTIVFSNEPDKYYNYQILDQIDYDKLIRFKTAKVKMHVQPFKYPLEETPVEINIQNVTGSGEAVDINNTADAPITLALKGNTSQDGTPTPTAPVEINTVTGRQEIIISNGTDTQSYELDLGKNILDLSNLTTKTANGITITKNEDGSVTINGTATSPTTFDIELPSIVTFQSGVTYTHSQGTKTSISSQYSLSLRQANYYPVTNSSIDSGSSSVTFTPSTAEQMKYYRIFIPNGITLNNQKIYPMVEKGGTATSYAPYKTPIEVNYIPNTDYQDYFYKDNNKWFIKREIAKLLLTGASTENYQQWGSQSKPNTELFGTPAIDNISNVNSIGLSNYFENSTASIWETDVEKMQINATGTNKIRFRVNKSLATDINSFKTWLGNNNVSIYYVLTTPEDEEITDATLIGQLNAIENARSYDPTTNISQNTPNKPFIINATAVKKGTDTGTVNNIGNIYAKPTIDIEGSGIVEIYLDGNQIFNVDLSTINECVIDTTNLEAYDPDTTQLMNRQVTGDYSNFKINVGTNQVKVSGAVTKATISNYTRWL